MRNHWLRHGLDLAAWPLCPKTKTTSATSATSEGAQGIFSKITFLKSVHFKEKDELCPGFEVEIFTKSLHRGGVIS